MSEKKSVAILEDVAPECVAALEAEGLAVDVLARRDEAGLVSAAPAYDGLIVGPGVRVSAAVLRAGRRLQVVASTGAAVDGIDVEAATRQGVIVAAAPGADAVSEAELGLALLLACARGLAGGEAALKGGPEALRAWADSGVEVRGKTLGLIGPDESSPALVEVVRALGMTVIAWTPGEPPAAVTALSVEVADTARLCAESDFVLVRPCAAGTGVGADAVVGVAELTAMKPGVRLVDLSGSGVDPAALAGALGAGRVAAAAVGVASTDAPAVAALAAAPNVLLTPLLAAATADARLRAGMAAAEQVAAVLRGELPAGVVNVPAAVAGDADEAMPHMGLCVQLGRLLVQLAEAPAVAVEITYGGSVAYFDTRLLTLGVLAGVLSERTGAPVNYVNAQAVADETGVTAIEKEQAGLPDFPRLITVAAGAEVSISGTTLGPRHKPRLVTLFGEDVDIEPSAHMAFLRYVDAPGIGGKLGTLLGEWGVNIAHMSVGRGKRGNESVMALTLDDVLTQKQADELAIQCGLLYARAVEL
jgi:D-3-phosphoglycerate dehydrogenase